MAASMAPSMNAMSPHTTQEFYHSCKHEPDEAMIVPSQYIRPPQERPSALSQSPILPVFDVAQLDAACSQPTLKKLSQACEAWGFFQVVNHGIPDELLERVRVVSRQFFELPFAEKSKCELKPGDLQGYTQQHIQPDKKVLDWGDFFSVVHSPAGDASRNRWPSIPADFRETIEAYSSEVAKLGKKLLRFVGESLGLEPHYLNDAYGEEVSQALRINYYPPCPQSDLVLGLTSHSDASGITLLLQDGTEGLQILKNGEWIQPEALPNAFVVNIGDQLEVISNGRYKSVEHRAVTNRRKPRISWATFYNPSWDFMIHPAPQLLDDTHPAFYSRFRSGDYILRLCTSKLEGKKLIESVKIGA